MCRKIFFCLLLTFWSAKRPQKQQQQQNTLQKFRNSQLLLAAAGLIASYPIALALALALASSGLALTLNGWKIPNRRLVINRRSRSRRQLRNLQQFFFSSLFGYEKSESSWLAFGHLIRADDDDAQAVPLTALSCMELFQVFSFRSVVD